MRFSNQITRFCVALFLIVLVNTTNAESRQTRTPARVLAKQTGATQFEEEHYETHKDCNEHKHNLRKRASDEDVDYEVYQGVVGRPGIDFPIYPRIPKTSFSCRSFGNGYFADMDTDCQVFHICEEGRKISFLCPNGTIFQQSELTCDWWFKVNCLGSPGYYAESAEILSKQRLQRLRPSVPVKGFNIVGGGLNIKPKINNTPTPKRNPKPQRRIDSSEQQPSVETVDFEDLSGEKPLEGKSHKVISNIDNNSNDNESQITAESSSFVSGRGRNSYKYDKPKEASGRTQQREQKQPHEQEADTPKSNNNKIAYPKSYSNPVNTNTESNERLRSGQRGQQRFKEDKKTAYEFNSNETDEKKPVSTIRKSALPEKIIGLEVSGRNIGGKAEITTEPDIKPEYYEAPNRATERTPSTTQFHSQATYSTARKLDNTRTTPYYTPTVPSVAKGKTAEGKSYYVKGKGGSNVSLVTTPNPNRLNGNNPGSGFFLESSAPPKTTASQEPYTSTLGTTFRPFIIGMRHSHDDDISSAEIHRLSLGARRPFSVDDLPVNNKFNNRKSESREYLPTTTPATTGPTYLPKTGGAPKGSANAAGDDLLLFAPNPVTGENVSRNLDEMLKAMNLLKSKISDAEEIKGTGSARSGLEIPPSSGPDVLISLAKYFATEQSKSNDNSLNDYDTKKSNEKQGHNTYSPASKPLPASKPSDTTATLTTAATPRVAVKSSDIQDSLLSERTVDRYTSLFGLRGDFKAKSLDLKEDEQNNKAATGRQSNDVVHTPFPQIATTDGTIRELAQKPESRRIAQTFSNALTNYLEDPKTFRQQLQSVRPTEPPSAAVENIKPNFEPVTSKDKLVFKSGTAASYLPTKPTSPIKIEATTTQSSIAAEINDKFEFSTQLPDFSSTTDQPESTTYRPAYNLFEKQPKLELSAELLPPSPESAEGEEFLHREQTQSFVKSRNELSSNQSSSKKKGKTNEAYASLPKPTENPWNSISQTDFLDPLTINDGLMKETHTTTVSPSTYLPEKTSTPRYTTARGKLQELAPTVKTQARNLGSRFSIGSAEVTTQSNRYQNLQESDSWRDILATYDLPLDTLPSSNGLQRIANRLFGGLNESEALHLKNVMQQAEHNRQVLRLLLLLIQTCDDQNSKALERSRKHLLNALIDMDSKLQAEHVGKVSHQRGRNIDTTTPTSLITTTTTVTNRRNDANTATSTINYPTTTTTDLPTTTTTAAGSIEETTKFEIRVEDPEEDQISTASTITANTHSSSDRRALELLKSLYSLASKFTSRR